MTFDDLLSLPQAAHEAGVSRQSIWLWMHAGRRGKRLTFAKVAGRLFTTRRDLQAFLIESSKPSKAEAA